MDDSNKVNKLLEEIGNLNDEECLQLFINLTDRVDIGTAFLEHKESGLIDKQLLILKCGDIVEATNHIDLETPLMVARPTELEVTLN